MMYVFTITTPASTPPTAKLKTILPLTRGKITQMSIQYPSGLQGFAHLVITRGLNQLFPTNPDGDFATSNETISWPEEYLLDVDPVQLEAYSWNLDDTFDHTITVRIVLQPITPTATLWEEVKALFTGTPGVSGG